MKEQTPLNSKNMDYTERIQAEAFRRYPIVETNHPTQERDLELKRKAYINGINSPLAKQITEIEKLEAKIEVLKWVNPILVDDIVKINYKIEQLETLRDKLINELKMK